MIKPLNNRTIVQVVKDDKKTPTGLVISKELDESQLVAEVVSVGENSPVKNKDKIIVYKYSCNPIKYGGKEYFIVKNEDILALIESK